MGRQRGHRILPLGLILLLSSAFPSRVSAMKDQRFKTSDAFWTDSLTKGNNSVVTKSEGDRSFHGLLWVLSHPKQVAHCLLLQRPGEQDLGSAGRVGFGEIGPNPAPGSWLPTSASGPEAMVRLTNRRASWTRLWYASHLTLGPPWGGHRARSSISQ